MAVARVTNLARTIEELKEPGVWTVAAVPDATRTWPRSTSAVPRPWSSAGRGRGSARSSGRAATTPPASPWRGEWEASTRPPRRPSPCTKRRASAPKPQARPRLDKPRDVRYKHPLRRQGQVFPAPEGQSRNFWGFAGVAQLAEQLPCKQQVAGSNPTASSSWLVAPVVVVRGREDVMEGFPSGQREQTVNLPAYAFGGSNPPPSTPGEERFAGIAQLVERQPSKLNVAGSNPVSRSIPHERKKGPLSSVGRARPW